MTTNKYYIDKKEMCDEIQRSKDNGRCSEELGLMFMKLAEKYSHHPNFRDYERKYGRAFKQDLIATGLHACARAWHKFDPEKSDNPFSFFTTCLFRAYIGYLSKEYGFSNTKNALKVDQGLRGDYGYEEMIKSEEEASMVEDEEEYIELSDNDDDDDEEPQELDEYGMPIPTEEEEPVVQEPPQSRRVVYDHLESMTLWDEELKKPIKKPTVSELFGVKK